MRLLDFSSSNRRKWAHAPKAAFGLLALSLLFLRPAAAAAQSTNATLTISFTLTAYIQQPSAGGLLPSVKVQKLATTDVLTAIGSDLGQSATDVAKASLLVRFDHIGATNDSNADTVLRSSVGDTNINDKLILDFPQTLTVLNNTTVTTARPAAGGGATETDYSIMSVSLNTANLSFQGQGELALLQSSVTSGKTMIDKRAIPNGYTCTLSGSGKVGTNAAIFIGTFTASKRKVETTAD